MKSNRAQVKLMIIAILPQSLNWYPSIYHWLKNS